MSIRQLRTAAEGTIQETRNAANIAAHAAAILTELGDEEGAAAVGHLARSLPRTPATVVVAGEFKAGKSSLINAMIGARVLPADPLATTPVPVRVLSGPELRLAARVRVDADGDGPLLAEQVLDRARYLDVFRDDDDVPDGLDHLEVRLPAPLLELGLQLVDTPSVSAGITSSTAGVVLGEIAAADAILFVTDAGQELTAPQLEFLRIAASLNQARVLVVMSKVDLYPHWRRLLDRNHDHLEAAFGEAPVLFGVSSALRRYAVRYGDETLDVESGLPLLLWYLVSTVLTEARQRALVAAAATLERRLADAEDSVVSSRRALSSAKERRLVQAQLAAAVQRVQRLEQQWQPKLRLELDRFQLDVDGDLSERLQFVARLMNQTIEVHDPGQEWPLIESQFNEAVNRATAAHLAFMRERAAAVYASMEEFLGVAAGTLSGGRAVELQERPIAVDLDRPDLVVNASAQFMLAGANVSRYVWVAGSAVGAVFTPVGWIAALATALAGLGVAGAGAAYWRGRTRSSALEEARRRARAQTQLDLAEASRAAGLASRAARSELNARLHEDIVTRIGSVKGQLQQEVVQLSRIADVADEHRPAKERELEELVQRIRQVRAHAAALPHRIERPLMQVPAR